MKRLFLVCALSLSLAACGEVNLTIDCPEGATTPYCAALLADGDGDGIPNVIDNCPNVANPDQADADGDGVGDACQAVVTPIDPEPDPEPDPDPDPELDSDGDGYPDSSDGCPNDPNKHAPGACGCGVPDGDRDGDGVPDCKDNCPDAANANQADYDGDGVGDACTPQDGTVAHPFIISPPTAHHVYTDRRNTANALSHAFDTYPPTKAAASHWARRNQARQDQDRPRERPLTAEKSSISA